MTQVVAELDKQEIARIQAAAGGRHFDPKHLTTKQLVLALCAAGIASDPAVMLSSAVQQAEDNPDDPAAAQRVQRLAAVMAMHGLWKNDPAQPQDGLAYQREVRSEWR